MRLRPPGEHGGFLLSEGLAEQCRGKRVMSGHQPGFFHPGIWFRAFLLDALPDSRSTWLVVDSDANRGLEATYPVVREGRLEVEREALSDLPELPTESLGPPDPERWERFCSRVGVELAGDFSAPDMVEFLRGVRRGVEGLTRSEVRLSELCRGPEFARFALRLLNRAERFRETYNRALGDFRVRHRLPDSYPVAAPLERDGPLVETPFWNLGGRERDPLWVDPARPSARYEQLRPRALALTLFCRLHLCDLFIHGTGGAFYEEINDQILREFFEVTPPPVGVASATFFLPLKACDEREVRFHPERYLPADHPLVLKKRAAIEAGAHARLGELNRALQGELRLPVASRKVLRHRGFSYFLFSPREVAELARRATGTGA